MFKGIQGEYSILLLIRGQILKCHKEHVNVKAHKNITFLVTTLRFVLSCWLYLDWCRLYYKTLCINIVFVQKAISNSLKPVVRLSGRSSVHPSVRLAKSPLGPKGPSPPQELERSPP